MEALRPIRVLVAKPGLDGHDRGAKVVVQALRDAGMEVIYSGLHRAPEEIVRAAVQEDVDIVGLSILSGAHLPLCRGIMNGLRSTGKPAILGGVIPERDEPELRALGIERIFCMGTPFEEIVAWIRKRCGRSFSSPASK